jgi:hypothetical protein
LVRFNGAVCGYNHIGCKGYASADATDAISTSVAGAPFASHCLGCVLWFISAVEIGRMPGDDKNRADGGAIF